MRYKGGSSEEEMSAVDRLEAMPDDTMFPQKAPREVVVLGLELTRMFPSLMAQLVFLGVALITSSTVFAALQERVLYVPGFRYTGWMAQLTSLTYVIIALLERLATRDCRRAAPVRDYLKLSLLVMGGMYLTNWSLQFLSYPLRVVFKSTKVLPVMLMSVIFVNKRYKTSEYLGVGMLSLGMVFFTLGDAKGRASFDPRGLALICIGTMFEAIAATFEEIRFFHELACPVPEVQLYVNLLGFFWAAVADVFVGDLAPAFQHSLDHPEAVLYIVGAAICGSVSQSVVLTLIKHYGATAAELLKSSRKIVTILVSFVIYGKPWTLQHLAGGFLFSMSIAVERYAEGGKARRFAVALIGSAILLGLWLLSGSGPPLYSIVIDAGSAGSRLHVFRYNSWTSRLSDIQGKAEVYVSGEPGLATCAPNNLTGVGQLLNPLLITAVAAIPAAQRALTPVALRATAEMRLLPEADSARILDKAKQVFKSFGFSGDAKILDAEHEGTGAWMSVNYLMGTFRPGVQSINQPVAVLDLRGGSVQAVYLLEEADAKAAERDDQLRDYVKKVVLPFGSGTAHLYQHSYLDYGLLAARVRAFDELGHEAPDSAHPCFQAGTHITWQYRGKEYGGSGSGNAKQCQALITQILHTQQPCNVRNSSTEGEEQKRCSFGGVWAGPGLRARSGRGWLLASYFFLRLRDAGAIEDGIMQKWMTLQEIERISADACRGGAGRSGLSHESSAWLCFDLAYTAALLRRVVGVELDEPLSVASEILFEERSFKVSWALGFSIEEVTQIGRGSPA